MLVGGDVKSHAVVVVAVIAETGAVPADSDGGGVQAAEMEKLEVTPDMVAVEDFGLTAVMTFVEGSGLIVLPGLKLLT